MQSVLLIAVLVVGLIEFSTQKVIIEDDYDDYDNETESPLDVDLRIVPTEIFASPRTADDDETIALEKKIPDDVSNDEVDEIQNADFVTCGPPPPVALASTTQFQKTEYPVGTTVTYTCGFGYVPKGESYSSKCLRSGKGDGHGVWTETNFICIPRSCGDPGFVTNAHRIGSRFTFPNSVLFECEDGFDMIGSGSRYCQASGTWSGRLPTCERVFCDPPEQIENGRVTFSSLDYGSELQYECNKGFLIKDYETRFCEANGTWSGIEPVCSEAQCDMPVAPEHGSFELVGGEPRVKSIVLYSCDDDRRLVGSATSKCLDVGKWTFPTPKCLDPCSIPEVPHGRIGRYTATGYYKRQKSFTRITVGSKVDDDEELYLQCDSKYEPLGNAKSEEQVTCNGGEWSDKPRCEPASCRSEPPQTGNGRPVSVNAQHMGTVVYHCNEYSQKTKTGNVTCVFGVWKGVTPVCKDSRCDLETLNFPGLVKAAKRYYSPGQSFYPLCTAGYAVSRMGEKLTCEDGRWNGHLPPCVAANCTDEPPSPTHGIAKSYTGIHSSAVKFQCDEGYILEESSSVNCLFGSWKGQPPRCKDSRCYPENLNQNKGLLVDRGRAFNSGEWLTAQCLDGYTPRAERPLCTKGEWKEYAVSPCKENGCTVHAIHNGAFTVKSTVDGNFNWRTWRWNKKDVYKNVGTGAHEQPLSSLYVTCDNGFSFQGRGSNNVAVTCNEGRWSPDPVCLTTGSVYSESTRRGQGGRIPPAKAFTAVALEKTTLRPASLPANPAVSAEDEDVCSCVYNGADPAVVAYVGNEKLHSGSKVKLHQTVTFHCQEFGYSRLEGPTTITCKDCQNWHSSEYPSCVNPNVGAALVFFDDNVRVLPGGMLEVHQGTTFRITCIANRVSSYPIWSAPAAKNVFALSTQSKQDGQTAYITFLDVKSATTRNTGRYQCGLRGHQATFIPIRITGSLIRCPYIEGGNELFIEYEKDRLVNSSALLSCRKRGRKLEGSGVLNCLPNGVWSGEIPKCVDNACPEFTEDEEMRITYTDYQNIGSTATFHCFPPRLLSGASQTICERPGVWTNPPPSCRLSSCSMESFFSMTSEGVVPVMDDVNNDTLPHGFILRLTCEGDLRLSGPSEAKCGNDGLWEVGKVRCVPGCGAVHTSDDSSVIVEPEKDFYRFGEFVTLSCPYGKTLTSEVERMMCLREGWSETHIPTCEDLVSAEESAK